MTTTVQKPRKSYIDVAKGLLILMVIWGHFELIARLCFKVQDDIICQFDKCEDFWAAFFMPAFFFITGLCTNFAKKFMPFLISGIRTILLPAMIIGYTLQIIDFVTYDVTILWIVKTLIKSVLLKAAGEWFIASLFLSRLAVWALSRIGRRSIRMSISIVLFIIGLVLYNSFAGIPEIWFFEHAMMAVIFMCIGYELKGSEDKFYKLWWVYIPLITITLLCGISVPYLTNRINIPYWITPLYALLSITGISFIMFVSNKINHSRILEYLGRNSLVIFLVHFTFYQIYQKVALQYIGISPILTVILIIAVYLLNVVSSTLVATILNLKPFRWILGK